MLKLGRRARGHFITLIEIRVHLIWVKPGHISKQMDQNDCRTEQLKQLFICGFISNLTESILAYLETMIYQPYLSGSRVKRYSVIGNIAT